jgi:hypothetical protein
MDPAEVRHLLAELKHRLENAGIAARIHVIGGSAMALHFPDDPETRMTQDIDAAIQPADAVGRVVGEMAVELGLSPTWLNANGAGFAPPGKVSPTPIDSVSLSIASVDELIAMKLAASREQDLHDLGILARHAAIDDPERLVDIAFDAYGEDSVVLNYSRQDYLIIAKQALARAKKRLNDK